MLYQYLDVMEDFGVLKELNVAIQGALVEDASDELKEILGFE